MRAQFFFIVLALFGCGSSWYVEDWDEDGWTIAAGDCVEAAREDTASGNWLYEMYGAYPEDVHPGAQETWYDGLDQNCDGLDDYDADRDGYVPDCYVGRGTFPNWDESGSLPGGDCNDLYYGAYPGAAEVDDNVDNDCDGDIDEVKDTEDTG